MSARPGEPPRCGPASQSCSRSDLPLTPRTTRAASKYAQRAPGLDSDADVYFLNARLELRLSTESREALESGLPINIRVEVEIIHLRRFLLDRETAALTQLYRLQYHALLELYTVRNVNSGNLDTFATLFAALNFLGRVDGLPLIDRALLESRPALRHQIARPSRHGPIARPIAFAGLLAARLVAR